MNTPVRCNLSPEAIRTYAQRVINFYQLHETHRGEALQRLAHELGGVVETAPTNVYNKLLHIHGYRDFTIYTPRVQNPMQDTVSIAQAIGHYYLAYLYPKRGGELTVYIRDNDLTRQANTFAYELIAPQELLHRVMQYYGDDVYYLAAQLGLTPNTLSKLAQNHDLLLTA